MLICGTQATLVKSLRDTDEGFLQHGVAKPGVQELGLLANVP